MATFDEIGNGSVNVGEILKGMTINSLSTMARGLIIEMLSTNIHNFNLMNYDYMNIHMMRNAYEKVITLNTVGESAYTDGNGDAQATPAQYPSYTRGNNYMKFVNNTRQASNNGVLSTRVTNRDGNVRNLYIDDEYNRDAQVEFTGSYLDKNSILYKTKKLIRQNKLKTIISQFHTEGVEYEGQIGSEYGESHGRNLLTKEAENGTNGYKVNGYDNPYCRVWTHHYQYDKLSKTMRANTSELNTWGGFEWEDTDKGHKKDDSHYGDGEKNYDYAWRGKHNQERREAHSVLDTKTGLVKITPQYRNGGQKNRHTKDCMFSIENLAWKDYDPYSFEQALSWEQRGPFGGRIMWFPPYGIEITETTSAKWNSNEFIGRGEPVYTYTNTERTGNLSFLMITDHPSSIDYASWWDDNTMIKGIDNGDGNSENDYLRYFAGCANDDNDGGDPKNNEPGKTGGLIIKPTPLTDEYLQEQKPPVIKVEKPGDKYPDPNKVNSPSKNPIYVEFFVFYPNNYSGVHDSPTKPDAEVDAIAYLLGGIGGQKIDGVHDSALSLNSVFSFESSENKYIGYEMAKGPITTDDCIVNKYYIQGGKKGVKEYIPDIEKKWCYRIDHLQPYSGKETALNTINQVLYGYKEKKYYNYKDEYTIKDNEPHKLNLSINDDIRGMKLKGDDDLYSFAEVAAAFHSSKMIYKPFLYDYISKCGVDQTRVNKLINIFTNSNLKLNEIMCSGGASSQGYTSFNQTLAKNRNETVYKWLTSYNKWNSVRKGTIDGDKEINPVKPGDENYVNAYSSKLGRCAHCILEFETEGVSKNTENRDLPGFKWFKSVPQTDGSVWNYYTKDENVKYFEQEASGDDNYKESESGDDVTVTELQLLQIFDTYKPIEFEIIKENPKYRGVYNEYGIYLDKFDYSGDNDDLKIHTFVDGETNRFSEGEHLYYKAKFYRVNQSFSQTTWSDMFVELGWLTDVTKYVIYYAKEDLVKHEDEYYQCKNDYIEVHPDYTFDLNDWDDVNTTNINEAIASPYRYKEASDKPYSQKDIIYNSSEDKFLLCEKVNYIPIPGSSFGDWELLYVTCYEEATEGDYWDAGDYVTHNDKLYSCINDNTPYKPIFDEMDWEGVETVYFSDLEDEFTFGEIVEYNDEYFKAISIMERYEWTDDLSKAMPGLIHDSKNPLGEFDGEYPYNIGDYCRENGKYYKSKVDFSGKDRPMIPFSSDDWETAPWELVYTYLYGWELVDLVDKVAAVLCWTREALIHEISGDNHWPYDMSDNPSFIWKYGDNSEISVDEGTDLASYAQQHNVTFTNEETEYIRALVENYKIAYFESQVKDLITLHRVLDTVKKVKGNNDEVRDVCAEPAATDEEMREKTARKDGLITENCKDNIWVDRGDGLLIQECNVGNDGVIARFNASTGEGDWNKLRYDQEYHFYKQWIADHPLMYEKLQEKIKYFNPAFHSMTPEGFNARCTFLQQCTRQGNTKTMSDLGGKTANNLAFGRPPYCVLRLGDFYYQMIVIDNITFDFSASDGLQWDLNTEGNGVQPMLCKVNISFKFIGGGDITGPVQRLQNAMSFNYYANTSFYDNRADRIEYKPTNWATMGGAGNNEVDLNNSYAYIAKLYEDQPEHIYKASDKK